MMFFEYNPATSSWSDFFDLRIGMDRYRTLIVESDGTAHDVGSYEPWQIAYRTVTPGGYVGPRVTQDVAETEETVEVASALSWDGRWFVSFIIAGRWGRFYVARRSTGTWTVDEIVAGPTDPDTSFMPWPLLYVYGGQLIVLWAGYYESPIRVFASRWTGSGWSSPYEFFDPSDLPDPAWRTFTSSVASYEALVSEPHLGYPVMMGYSADGSGSPGVDDTLSFVISAVGDSAPPAVFAPSGTRRTVVLVPNFFDACLDRMHREFCRFPWPVACSGYDAVEEYRAHVSMPKRAKPFRARRAVPTPLPSDGDVVVLRFEVPVGYDAVVTGIYHHYTGPGFRNGSGDIIWRVRTGVIYPRWMGAMLVEMGDLDAHFPISGLWIPSGRSLDYIVNVPNLSGGILPGSSQIVCSVEGWLIPRS